MESKPNIRALNNPIPQQPLDEIQLIRQVGDWAYKNFRDKRADEWGIIEEVGEAAHCILKRRQGIRGFDNEDFFLAQLTDALADTIIYLASWCAIRNCFFKFGRNQIHDLHPNSTDERRVGIHLLQGAAQMLSYPEVSPGDSVTQSMTEVYNQTAQRICNGIECWAAIYNIDIRWAVAATWAKVGKRDWNINPQAPTPDQQ